MKLLVATEFSPDAPGGGPAVIRQMLQGFPGELHWWSCRPAGGAAADWKLPVASFRCCPPGKLMPERKVPQAKAWLMEHLWAPRATRHLRSALAQLQPGCVWAIPHDWSILPLCGALLPKTGKSPPFHVTLQDYPDAHGHALRWGEARTTRLVRLQQELYARARSRDATSLPMLEDLETQTGAKGSQMLHQGLEPEDFAFLQNSTPQAPRSRPIRIAYAGTILVEPEFAWFAGQLEQLRASGLDLRLELWGAHSYAHRSWFRPEWMREHGNLPERRLLEALRECDWGFIPMGFEDADPRYNRFSFPTKFITYLAAGLPIITLGHPDSSVMKMAEAYEVGFGIRDSGFRIQELAAELGNPEAKARFRPEILRCARTEFDAEKMRFRLWECLAAKMDQAPRIER
jgi:hypothetical protein